MEICDACEKETDRNDLHLIEYPSAVFGGDIKGTVCPDCKKRFCSWWDGHIALQIMNNRLKKHGITRAELDGMQGKDRERWRRLIYIGVAEKDVTTVIFGD
jgi:hypothetical protein